VGDSTVSEYEQGGEGVGERKKKYVDIQNNTPQHTPEDPIIHSCSIQNDPN
jgi:hypothetical protein